MKKSVVLAVLAGMLLLCAQNSCTQLPSEELKALRKEVDALKERHAAMQKELQETKELLKARAAGQPTAPQDVVLNVDGEPFKGSKTAKLVLVEFSDYQ